MKKAVFILLLPIYWQTQAQKNVFSEKIGRIKIGAGYSKDFPGLHGYGIHAEYSHSLHPLLEGGFGIKRINISGYPRTALIKEYTKATTLDFNIYFLLLTNERNTLKLGTGYTFSFYKTRRSYPLVETSGTEKITTWPIQDASGRSTGIIFSGEYEHEFTDGLSLGLKVSLCKAYDRVFYASPYVAIRL
jgi:hypothetical protein